MSDQSISLSLNSTTKERKSANDSRMKLSHFLQVSFENPDLETSQILEGVSCHSNDLDTGKNNSKDISRKTDYVGDLLEENKKVIQEIKALVKAIVEKRRHKSDSSGFYREQTGLLASEHQQLEQILLRKFESHKREFENLQENDVSTSLKDIKLSIQDFGRAIKEFYEEIHAESGNIQNINSLMEKFLAFSERMCEKQTSAHKTHSRRQSDVSETLKLFGENPCQNQEKTPKKELEEGEKPPNPSTIYYSVEQPISLSYHIYLEALQEKINEVNELKHALMEVAAFATNDKIREKLKGLRVQSGIKTYNNKYIASSVDCIKEWIAKEGSSQRAEKLEQTLAVERKINNEVMQKYRNEMWERRNLHNKLEDLKGTIRVYCRIRPALSSENIPQISLGEPYISYPETNSVKFYSALAQRGNVFEFDKVFASQSDQQHVFDELTPLITSVLDGYNVCIMAYGQTGSGKTYTMEGKSGVRGMIQLSLEQIFEIAQQSKDVEYSVSISMLEVYNEQIRDLLQGNPEKSKLDIREIDHIVTLNPKSTVLDITNYDEAEEIINKGRINRKKGATSSNALSSRSHCIVTINVVAKNHILNKTFTGKLHMVDLAGSERIYKSESEGERLKEACNINQSLTTLGKVLNNLAIKSSHIPYRESKLTHLLKDSLGGTAKTLLIIQCSPNPHDLNESLSTLQFGVRVSKVEKGKAKQNTSELWNENSFKGSEIVAEVNLKEATNKMLLKHRKTESLLKLEKAEKENCSSVLSCRSTKSPKAFQTRSFVHSEESGAKTIPKGIYSESPEPISIAVSAFNKTKELHHSKNNSSQISLTSARKVDMLTAIEPLRVNLDKTAKKKLQK